MGSGLCLFIAFYAGAVMNDRLLLATRLAFVVKRQALFGADREVNARANANSVGRGWAARSVKGKFFAITFQIAKVVISPAIFSANRGNIPQAINAFLQRVAFTTTVKSLLCLGAAHFAIIYIIAAVNAANGFINEGAGARGGAVVQCAEIHSGTFKHAGVLISNSVLSAD